MAYVELHACSAFSFLRGASFPEHLADTAADAGNAGSSPPRSQRRLRRATLLRHRPRERRAAHHRLRVDDGRRERPPRAGERQSRLRPLVLAAHRGTPAQRHQRRMRGAMERAAKLQRRPGRFAGERTLAACWFRHSAETNFQNRTRKITQSNFLRFRKFPTARRRRIRETLARHLRTQRRLRRTPAPLPSRRRAHKPGTTRSRRASSTPDHRYEWRAIRHPPRPGSARRLHLHPRAHPPRCRGHAPHPKR